jgi:hypothetical protein
MLLLCSVVGEAAFLVRDSTDEGDTLALVRDGTGPTDEELLPRSRGQSWI